jgi:hypothetical protein
MSAALRAKKPAVELTTDLLTITPEYARELLKANGANRSLRKQLVRTYANEMLAGRWRITGEAIQFGTDGRLLNGQHRLNAVVMADVPVTFLVIYGIDPDAQLVMDSGAKRTAGDALGLLEIPNAPSSPLPPGSP